MRFEHERIDDDLFCPHTAQVADFDGDGDGRSDLLVGEMGLDENDEARLFVYRNRGAGLDRDSGFERIEIGRGIPTHEAKAVDLTEDGSIDIVGKSHGPDVHVDAWLRRE